MSNWWDSLNFNLQIFYGIGIFAVCALAVQSFLTLFVGVGHEMNLPDSTDHGSGVGLFSVRGITAFFLGFGWAGVIAMNSGISFPGAIGIGLAVGIALMFLILLLMRSMLRLQSNGTLDYANAVGQTGTVYVTIQPDQKAGGQVELMLQGRLTMAGAIHRGLVSIPPGTKIKIIEKIGTSTLVVERL